MNDRTIRAWPLLYREGQGKIFHFLVHLYSDTPLIPQFHVKHSQAPEPMPWTSLRHLDNKISSGATFPQCTLMP